VPAKPGNCRFDSLDACRLSACQAADDSGRSRGLLGTKPPGASQQSVSSCWRTGRCLGRQGGGALRREQSCRRAAKVFPQRFTSSPGGGGQGGARSVSDAREVEVSAGKSGDDGCHGSRKPHTARAFAVRSPSSPFDIGAAQRKWVANSVTTERASSHGWLTGSPSEASALADSRTSMATAASTYPRRLPWGPETGHRWKHWVPEQRQRQQH